jgi:hypothetical protein
LYEIHTLPVRIEMLDKTEGAIKKPVRIEMLDKTEGAIKN